MPALASRFKQGAAAEDRLMPGGKRSDAPAMLETLFIWGFVVLPLAVAVVLIAYRVRVFLIGIILISLTAAAGWVAISAIVRF